MLVAKSHCDSSDKKLVRPSISKPSAVSLNRLQLSEDSLGSLALDMVSETNTCSSSGLSPSEHELSRQIVQLFSLSELVSVSGKKSSPCSEKHSPFSVALPSRSRRSKATTDTKNVLNFGQHFALSAGRVVLSTLAEEMNKALIARKDPETCWTIAGSVFVQQLQVSIEACSAWNSRQLCLFRALCCGRYYGDLLANIEQRLVW